MSATQRPCRLNEPCRREAITRGPVRRRPGCKGGYRRERVTPLSKRAIAGRARSGGGGRPRGTSPAGAVCMYVCFCLFRFSNGYGPNESLLRQHKKVQLKLQCREQNNAKRQRMTRRLTHRTGTIKGVAACVIDCSVTMQNKRAKQRAQCLHRLRRCRSARRRTQR